MRLSSAALGAQVLAALCSLTESGGSLIAEEFPAAHMGD